MHSEDHTTPTSGRFVGVVLAIALVTLPGIAAADIAKQRELFKDVYETVERGDWSPVDGLSASERKLLEQYVLWPDLRATWLRANLKSAPAAEVDAFIQQYGTLRPARELRYRQAMLLARDGDLAGFRRIYETVSTRARTSRDSIAWHCRPKSTAAAMRESSSGHATCG